MAGGDSRFDVADPRFEAEQREAEAEYGEPVPPKRRSPWTACLIGCLVFVVLAVLVFAGVAYWVWQNWRELAATGASQAMNQMIDATDLPAEERQEMKLEVERVADAFREGRLTNEQLGRIVTEVANSPLLTLLVVSAVEKQYLDQSGLSQEEKAEGKQALQRFVRGAVDGEIGEKSVDAVLAHVADRQPDGTWRLRERVSDADLRAALAEAKRAADEAGVPQQPEEVDASGEFKRIVDEAMGAGIPMADEAAPE